MAKPPKVQIPGLNRGAGIPPGYIVGRLPGAGTGPAQLITQQHLTRLGVATKAQLTAIVPPVTSVFGRTGAVIAQTGDYTAAEVTNAADVTAANTFSNSNTQKIAGGGACVFTVEGEGSTRLVVQRSSTDNVAPIFTCQKSRGTIASPTGVANGDQLFSFRAGGYNGSSGFTVGGQLLFSCIDPGAPATMGTQFIVQLAAVGANSATNFLTLDKTSGLVIGGVTIVNGSGVLQIPNSGVTAGAYTSANITVGADGRITAAANGSGGGGTSSSSYEKSVPKPPTTGTLTAFNNHVTTLVGGSFSSTMNLHGSSAGGLETWEMAAPATPYDIVCRLQMGVDTGGQAGIMVRNSSSGKLVTLGHYTPGSGQGGLICQNWTNPTTFNSNIYVAPWNPPLAQWLRINNDGTTLTFYVSYNGSEWAQLASETLASFISSADKVGIYGGPPGSGTFQMAWFSWFDKALP